MLFEETSLASTAPACLADRAPVIHRPAHNKPAIALLLDVSSETVSTGKDPLQTDRLAPLLCRRYKDRAVQSKVAGLLPVVKLTVTSWVTGRKATVSRITAEQIAAYDHETGPPGRHPLLSETVAGVYDASNTKAVVIPARPGIIPDGRHTTSDNTCFVLPELIQKKLHHALQAISDDNGQAGIIKHQPES